MPEPLPPDYASRVGGEKLDLLWRRVSAEPYPEGELPWREPGLGARRKLFSPAHHAVSFTHEADELPPGREKLIHRFGVVARASFRRTVLCPYTGLFATGGVGLIRVSAATVEPSFNPSLAFKHLLTGRPSVNWFAMESADGQGTDHEPFKRAWSNALPQPTRFDAKVMRKVLKAALKRLDAPRVYPVYLPLHHMAAVEADGTAVAEPVVPDRIVLTPTAQARVGSEHKPDWRLRLAKLPRGTKLFDVALADDIDSQPEAWGELVIETPFVASAYGDETLFFQHDRGPAATPKTTPAAYSGSGSGAGLSAS